MTSGETSTLTPLQLPLVSLKNLQKKASWVLGSTHSDELESVDIGKGDRPRPTWINKKLEPEFEAKLVKLLQEFSDCFAWEYHEMPSLDRSIIEHKLPIKLGYHPYMQHSRKIDATIVDQVKAEIERVIEAGFIRSCR